MLKVISLLLVKKSIKDKMMITGISTFQKTSRKKILFFYSFIFVACLGVYYQTLFYGFTNHDDDIIITQNIEFISDFSNLKQAFLTDAWCRHQEIELYRPLQSASYIIDAQYGDDIAFTTHLTNLILHVLCCICVFHLLLLFKLEDKTALLGALIYAVHYFFLHTVIWIPARGDLLLALFSFLAMITFIKLTQTDNWFYVVLHVVCFGIALFSKETGILLPLIFFVYIFLFYKDRLFKSKNFIILACYILIFLIYSYLRGLSISKTEQSLGLLSLLLNLRTIPETIAKLIVPVNFSTMPFFHFWTTLIGMLIIIGGTLFFILKKGKFNKLILFSLCWFTFFLLPGMIYRPEFASYTYEYLDHRSYLPSFGILMIGLGIFQNAKLKGKIFWLVSCIFLAYLISLNYYFHRFYKNPLVFSELAIKASPKSSLAHFIHGYEIYKLKDIDGALNDYNIAIKNYPKFFDARFNRAVILNEKKQYKAALEDLNYLLEGKPDNGPRVYNLRAVVKATLNDGEGANKDFETALKLDPNDPITKKDFETFKSSIVKVPENVQHSSQLNELGVEEAKKGNFKLALTYFEHSVSEYPENYQAIVNIGNCKDALGDRKGACLAWKKAADKGSKSASEMLKKYYKAMH